LGGGEITKFIKTKACQFGLLLLNNWPDIALLIFSISMTFITFNAKKWDVNSELCQVHTQVHARFYTYYVHFVMAQKTKNPWKIDHFLSPLHMNLLFNNSI
jgi:hypothetical protein